MKYLFGILYDSLLYDAFNPKRNIVILKKMIRNKIGLLLCHSHIELKLSWGWNWGWGWFETEVLVRMGQILVEIELSWGWDKLTLNKGRNWAFTGVG